MASYGECLLNETHHKQSGKDIEKHEESPILSKNFMNFGPQAVEMGPKFLPHLPKILPSASLPGVAHGGQKIEPCPTTLCQTEEAKWSRCEPNKVASHSEYKCKHRNWVAGVPAPQKQFELAMASPRVALSGNTSLIAIFSSIA